MDKIVAADENRMRGLRNDPAPRFTVVDHEITKAGIQLDNKKRDRPEGRSPDSQRRLSV